MTVAGHGIDGIFLVSKKERRKRFRRSVLDAWRWRCAYCDADLSERATLDHIVPMSRGGPTCRGNVVAACARCNGSKSDRDMDAWFREQSFYCRRREWVIWLWRLTQGEVPLGSWCGIEQRQ